MYIQSNYKVQKNVIARDRYFEGKRKIKAE